MGGTAPGKKMIMELWKNWDDNAFDRHILARYCCNVFDGRHEGKKGVYGGCKRYRGSMSTATSSIDACGCL